MIGNGYCNDETNNAEGNYDGGDCCGTNVNTDYCSDCKCYKVACVAGIVPHPMVGDSICNDEANHLECNYDAGDCCGSCIVKQYCSDCQCLGEDHRGNSFSSPSIGDGFCHDDNNKAECNFDGGDCCGSCVNTEHCIECACYHEVSGNGIPNGLVEDGFCNDETNNPDCNYDGGDCCGSCVVKQYCSNCECLGVTTLVMVSQVHQLVMVIAKMETTMVPATMMVVTVVELVLLLNTARNANVLEEKLAMMFLMLLEMVIVMMQPTMLNATMMGLIVVEQMSLQSIVWNVLVATVCIST